MTQKSHALRRRIAALASKQHGNVTRRQLLALGLSTDTIRYRIAAGELFPVYRGVYAVGRPARHPLESAAAAVLACGEGAALSHESAMVLWELWARWPKIAEVSLVTGDSRPRGILTHHPVALARRDITTHRGIRVTAPGRTLLDMACRMTEKTLTRAVNNALNSPCLTEGQLTDVLRRNPKHRATRLLAPLASLDAGLTRSELEDAFRTFCQTYGLPRPKTNVLVGGYLVDAYFEAEQLIVELDSWRFHKDRRAFETDRRRDADALSRGIPTVRITHERIQRDPDAEAARLRAILEQRRQMLNPTRAPQPGGARASRAARPARRRARDRRAR